MQIDDLAALTRAVLWAAFGVSALFGALAQRTRFCTMGAISDVVGMGDWLRVRQWALALGVALIGFASMAWAGLIDPARTVYASGRWMWLSSLLGGGLFGFGMVLASGCGSQTLVRVGAGNLKSLVVFVFMGLAAYATLRGLGAVVRVATVDTVFTGVDAPGTLPAWLAARTGWAHGPLALGLGLGLGALLVAWALSQRDARRAEPVLAGVGVGCAVLAMWWITGHLAFVTEHPETLEDTFVATASGRSEALSFTAPMAQAIDWLILFSDRARGLTVGVVSVAGVVAGSMAVALVTGRFRWEGFGGTQDLAHHLVGALAMGTGGVTAMGCSIGQGLSGASTLSLGSLVALPAIVAGAVAGLKYQMWQLERQA